MCVCVFKYLRLLTVECLLAWRAENHFSEQQMALGFMGADKYNNNSLKRFEVDKVRKRDTCGQNR